MGRPAEPARKLTLQTFILQQSRVPTEIRTRVSIKLTRLALCCSAWETCSTTAGRCCQVCRQPDGCEDTRQRKCVSNCENPNEDNSERHGVTH